MALVDWAGHSVGAARLSRPWCGRSPTSTTRAARRISRPTQSHRRSRPHVAAAQSRRDGPEPHSLRSTCRALCHGFCYHRTNVRHTDESGGIHANCSQQRDADARWAGHAHGQPDARILDPRLPVLGTQGRRRADAAHAAGRAAHRLPRHRRPGRRHGASLPAPLRLAVLRAQRGRRPALRLSRLEVRRRRQLPRHAERAAGAGLQGTASRPRPTRWSSARASSGPTWAAREKRRRCPTSKC